MLLTGIIPIGSIVVMAIVRVLTLILALLPISSAQAENPHERHRKVDALFAPWDGTTTPGCAVAVSRDGALDYARGYGMASLEYDVAITPESIFHAASVSKQFTAFAIGLLAQDGKLSLDDDVRKYLPELPDYGHKVTLAQMVHHTAGMREEFHLMYLAGWRYDDPRTEADALRISAMQRALNFIPGTEPLYSNSHYTPLAMVIQRVSGQPLRAFAEERIFRPLGMTDTRFQDGHTEVVRRRATGYRAAEEGRWRVSLPRSDFAGASNLMTTVGDLLKWQQNLIDARVGGRALVDWMQTSATLNNGEAIGYGGGLRIGHYRGLRTVAHDGADAGYRSDVVAFPDQKLVVVALCNSATIVPGALTRKVAEVYLGDRMTAETPTIKMSAPELSALTGTWWSPAEDAIVRLSVKDGMLRVAGSPDPLLPIGNGVFRVGGLTGMTGEWRFSAPASAPRELRITDAWPMPRLFTRLTAPVPSASALTAYAGQFRSEEVDMTYTVRAENGKLSLRWAREMSLTLEPVGGDHFIDGIYTVTFTRAPSGDVNGLTISTRRVRRLRAERLASPTPTQARALASHE
jgi:CubicO group peptidase (beta-lactamase class C family)